jgi:hypothetical protein
MLWCPFVIPRCYLVLALHKQQLLHAAPAPAITLTFHGALPLTVVVPSILPMLLCVQALLAQMLAEGYGCKQDLEESRRWAERARCRGYQMSGVYCEL